ncbi:inositol monophosphatase family protein [Blastococcus sp. CCUG 61487]|uniref:inositol monophosphatase family protein n=1 Tax=Blastococcus sp. CCUG 61487 TaxID=1840703 RepID=UPI0010C0143D|nr:inositol monophosphatase family protein [Blastococcus sp. CCUG 61487]TKJ19303.1 hypothetical protein A6V29_10320 [Blastococcus sp. CCUG 61487]
MPADRPGLRMATSADLTAVGDALGLPPAALAPALVEPAARALVGSEGQVVLLRRQWAHDSDAEAVVVRRRGVPLDHPDVLAVAVGWGCTRVRHLASDRWVAVPGPSGGAPLPVRFLHFAALAATRVETLAAVARLEGETHPEAVDALAQAAAVPVLHRLGVPVLSEGAGDQPPVGDGPWIALDPLGGTRSAAMGLPPWAFSAALVQGGRPVAGLVADLSSGRRWTAVRSLGAWRDGMPVRPRTDAAVPGAVRVTGCTAVDLCLVADGAVAAGRDVDRTGRHVRDVAGGLAVLMAAGGTALTPDGGPLELRPGAVVRFVAAADETAARELIAR